MSKKSNRGFTLVELLAVIVILAIILIIAVPGVLSIINQTKQKGYESQLKMIQEAAKNYITSESNQIQWKNGSDGSKKVEIKLQTLQSSGYLDKKIIDPRDKSEITCATTIVERAANNKMTYTMQDTNCPTDESCFTFDPKWKSIMSYSEDCPRDVVIPSEIGGVPVEGVGGFDASTGKDKITSVVIPDGVKTIGDQAFWHNELTSVVIPSSVEYIGQFAFMGNKLKKVVLSDGLKNIGFRSFEGNQITELVLPDSVEFILQSAFSGNQLTSVKLSSKMTTIPNDLFRDNQITSVEIPNGVTSIGSNAFQNNQLTTLTIPSSVTEIYSEAFLDNPLTSVVVKGKTALSDFTTISNTWCSGNPTITFEP